MMKRLLLATMAALDARRAGTVSGSIYVLDGTADVPEGYIVDNGRLVRSALFIKLR